MSLIFSEVLNIHGYIAKKMIRSVCLLPLVDIGRVFAQAEKNIVPLVFLFYILQNLV